MFRCAQYCCDRFLKSTTAATMVGGPKTFGKTKKLNSIGFLGSQTTWGTNKIQETGRGRKLNIQIKLDKSILIKLWGGQNENYALLMFVTMLKFTRFLWGPNGPKMCGRRTKTDFRDWAAVCAHQRLQRAFFPFSSEDFFSRFVGCAHSEYCCVCSSL